MAQSGHHSWADECLLLGVKRTFLVDAIRASIIGEAHLKKLASMLHREHVCIEIGNPLLALLRYLKITQRISDIRSHRLPEEPGLFARRSATLLYFSLLLIPVSRNSLNRAACFRK